MKEARSLTLLVFMVLFTSSTWAQKTKLRFADVNLSQLRSEVLQQLSKDQLIESKKERIYLFLRDDAVSLNGTPLDAQLTTRYRDLLAPYELGTGAYRAIFISREGTGIGDFEGGGLHCKFKGKLTKDDTNAALRFAP